MSPLSTPLLLYLLLVSSGALGPAAHILTDFDSIADVCGSEGESGRLAKRGKTADIATIGASWFFKKREARQGFELGLANCNGGHARSSWGERS